MDDCLRILDFVNAPTFVLEMGRDGIPRYAAVNKAIETLLDRPSHEIVGLSALQLFPTDVAKTILDHHRRVFENAQPATYEVSLITEFVQKVFQATLIPELDGKGQAWRAFGTISDVSGDLIARTVQSDTAAFQSEMEDFINLAAHDLRAPVRNVSTIAAMLREDFQDLGDGKLELIDMLETIGSKALELIGDVLACAQMSQAGSYQASTFDFKTLVQELRAVLDPMATCTFECVSVDLHCDRVALQLVLRNLIENALKYSRRDDGTLSLSLDVRAADDQRIEVILQDDGPGFDDAALLFLSGGTFRTGSGFGLLGVRRLLSARGGSIAATNVPNGGAEVRFALPGKLLDAGALARAV